MSTPLPQERLQALVDKVGDAIRSGGDFQGKVATLINQEGPNDFAQVFAYVLQNVISTFNVMQPVSYGVRLNDIALRGINDFAVEMAHGRRDPGVLAVQECALHASLGEDREVGHVFGRVWSTNDRDGADMVIVSLFMLKTACRFMQYTQEQIYTRAAELRMYLGDVWKQLQKEEWCEHCLPKAVAVADLCNDSAHTAAPEGLPAKKDDLSFLNGIKWE